MTGAEICCVLMLRPWLVLLPRLPRLAGVMRPLRAPCIHAAAPPGMEPKVLRPELGRELERWWAMRLFLYRRATKNMAAPYAMAPTMAPLATMALVEFTLRLAPMSPPMAPPSPDPLGVEPLPVPPLPFSGAEPSLGRLPAESGHTVLIWLVKALTVGSLLCQKAAAGLRS